MTDGIPDDFRDLSVRLGSDPLQVQGPGGNTSIKLDGTLWIKASGTELADAARTDIFVPVNRDAALEEARGAGDGTCRAAVIGDHPLRPSIETTFHALIDWPVTVHTHSVATLVHAICPEGRAVAARRLAGLPAVFVPYAKPGLPLTRAIAAETRPDTQVWVLHNHGLICAGPDVDATTALIAEVQARLALPGGPVAQAPTAPPPTGHEWIPGATALATDPGLRRLATAGSYYPDHVVFLGPALPEGPTPDRPAVLMPQGAAISIAATTAQRAMLHCLADVLGRLPEGWTPEQIGPAAEAGLLDWDAEKYRQALAARGAT